MQKYLILVTNFKLYISQHRCKTCSQWHTFRITLEKQHAHGRKKKKISTAIRWIEEAAASQPDKWEGHQTTSHHLRGPQWPLSPSLALQLSAAAWSVLQSGVLYTKSRRGRHGWRHVSHTEWLIAAAVAISKREGDKAAESSKPSSRQVLKSSS